MVYCRCDNCYANNINLYIPVSLIHHHMSFKFEFKIDYEKLTNLLDAFLKSHSDELTSIMGKCLVLEPSSPSPSPSPPPSSSNNGPITTTKVIQAKEPDHTVDNRPLIGDTIPDEPLGNLFQNANATTTRFQDRNNKGFI